MLVELDTIYGKFEGQGHGLKFKSQEENIAKVVGVAWSEGFLVFRRRYILDENCRYFLYALYLPSSLRGTALECYWDIRCEKTRIRLLCAVLVVWWVSESVVF